MFTIKQALEQKKKGLYYGNRIILPFEANFLKIVVDKEIITDFSPAAGTVYINESGAFTDIYFNKIDLLSDKVTKYEAIKIIAAEKDADIFNFHNHLKFALYLEDNHQLKIEPIDEDIIFIE